MFLRLLLFLCLLVFVVSGQMSEKRRVGLRYMASEDDTPYNYGARMNANHLPINSLRGRYGKRADESSRFGY